MSADELLWKVIQEWVAKAESDLVAATELLKLGKRSPTEAICFHAQQCVEKYVKALMVAHWLDVPKTHILNVLLSKLPLESHPALTQVEQDRLNEYAVGVRYPETKSPTLSEARHAVALARRVRADVRRKVPNAALRRPKPHAR